MPEAPALELAFAALEARLVAALPDLKVERNRDAEVSENLCPLLVLRDGDYTITRGDQSGAYGLSLYRVSAAVEGYVTAGEEALLNTAITLAHARVVRAMVCDGGATPSPIPLAGGVTEIWPEEVSAARTAAAVVDSAAPFASFVAGFEFDLRVPEGSPFFPIP